MGLKETVEQLREARLRYTSLKDELDDLYRQFEESHRELIESVQDELETVSRLEEQARAERLSLYEKDKRKDAIYGVSIKEMTELVYKEEEAIAYAKERLPDALVTRLDKRVFEKVAETGILDFVIIVKRPKAFISKEL